MRNKKPILRITASARGEHLTLSIRNLNDGPLLVQSDCRERSVAQNSSLVEVDDLDDREITVEIAQR